MNSIVLGIEWLNLEKSVGSRILAQAIDSTALKKCPLNLMGEAQIFLKHCETNILHYNSVPN